MAIKLYKPFDTFSFDSQHCFLTGKKINSETENISVFPEWILQRYELHEKPFSMLGENAVKYAGIRVPCTQKVINDSINPLEEEIKAAFTAGYDEVKKIPELHLFQWMAKLVYGILYNDVAYAVAQYNAKEKAFKLSAYLTQKFSNLHLMLQSLIVPMEFKDSNPWSIEVVKLNYSKDIFNYKDETKNLNFSLGMNGFGIVACLQDNGENAIYHRSMMNLIGDTALHAIQFEELWCRFMYSNYLLRTSSTYTFSIIDGSVIVQPVPLKEYDKNNLFEKWDDKTYAQVLANYWKPWGLGMKEIVDFPNSPISYLLNEYTNELIEPSSISLPH